MNRRGQMEEKKRGKKEEKREGEGQREGKGRKMINNPHINYNNLHFLTELCFAYQSLLLVFLPLTPTLKIANSLLDTIIFKLTQKSSRKTKTTSRLLRNFPRCTELTSKGGWGQERPKKQADYSRIEQFSKGTYGQKQSLGDRGLINTAYKGYRWLRAQWHVLGKSCRCQISKQLNGPTYLCKSIPVRCQGLTPSGLNWQSLSATCFLRWHQSHQAP